MPKYAYNRLFFQQKKDFALHTRIEWFLKPPYGYLAIPLWIPAAVTLAATAGAWRLDALARRNERRDSCKMCGYDLAGLPPGSACPECNKVDVIA